MSKRQYGVFMAVIFALCSTRPLYAAEGTDGAWKVSVGPMPGLPV